MQRRWGSLAPIDAPVGESSEQYQVTVIGPEGSIEYSAAAPNLEIAAAGLAGVGSGQVTLEVRQIGDAAASRPAELTLNI